MNEAKHTPGPWTNECFMVKSLHKGTTGPYGGIVICHTGTWEVRNGSEAEANAKLIAAAPEMLEALQYVLSGISRIPDDVMDTITNAIRKATQ